MINNKNSIWSICIGLFILLSGSLLSCKGQGGKSSENKNAVNNEYALQKPVIIEVVGASGKSVNPDVLIKICKQNDIPDPDVYQWNTHLVVYGHVKEPAMLQKQIASALPDAEVNVYHDPFYEFNRAHCTNKSIAKEWDHIILTANLVEDTVLQKEYLAYHATQFQKWPEVSNGFCNAGFQQLLLFRNGRQLMLVISIPEGKSLDELNPKTTENNPRVNDWNSLMKKYQEGIQGTKPGEVWVFLEKI